LALLASGPVLGWASALVLASEWESVSALVRGTTLGRLLAAHSAESLAVQSDPGTPYLSSRSGDTIPKIRGHHT
jgi:hypothetical protein